MEELTIVREMWGPQAVVNLCRCVQIVCFKQAGLQLAQFTTTWSFIRCFSMASCLPTRALFRRGADVGSNLSSYLEPMLPIIWLTKTQEEHGTPQFLLLNNFYIFIGFYIKLVCHVNHCNTQNFTKPFPNLNAASPSFGLVSNFAETIGLLLRIPMPYLSWVTSFSCPCR